MDTGRLILDSKQKKFSLFVLSCIGLFPTAYAQIDVQKVVLCGPSGRSCGDRWVQYVRQR